MTPVLPLPQEKRATTLEEPSYIFRCGQLTRPSHQQCSRRGICRCCAETRVQYWPSDASLPGPRDAIFRGFSGSPELLAYEERSKRQVAQLDA